MTTEAVALDTSREPEDLTTDEFDQVVSVLKSNVDAGLADPLLNLDVVTEQRLLRLAYHDGLNLDRLERIIREAIRSRGDGETQARRFTLKAYRTSAKGWKAKVAEEKLRELAIRKRNLRVIEGGKDDADRKAAEQLSDDSELQAKMFSQSAFLKAMALLEAKRAGRIWYDRFYAQFYSDWDGTDREDVVPAKAVDDEFMLNVYEWLLLQDAKLATSLSIATTEQALHAIGFKDTRSEPLDWLKGLQWDGTKRLATWLTSVYGVEKSEYYSAVGRCWIVSMVARIMQPGCKVDTMPVLIGPQGNRKSTSLSILGGKWYATINISVDKQQDFLMSLAGLLVAEVAELDAIGRAADSRVKTMLSTAVDKFRPPYGRTVREFARTAVLAGSTNDGSWHKDDTGGRRYWPIVCRGLIDTEWLAAHRDQLFAEARTYYIERQDTLALQARGGDVSDAHHQRALHDGSWWNVPRDEQERLIAEYHTQDPWQDRIVTWIDANKDKLMIDLSLSTPRRAGDLNAGEEWSHWGTLVTTSRLATQVLQLTPGQQNRVSSLKIAQAMRNAGFEQKSVRCEDGRVMRAWVVTDVDFGSIEQKSLPLKA